MAQLPLQTHIYISTLPDLKPGEMLKVDVSAGVYELMEYLNGYLFVEKTTNVKDIKIVKIFSTRSGDYGLSGTYWDGETSDLNHMRLYNVNICNELLSKKRQSGIYQDRDVELVTSEYYSDLDNFFVDSEDDRDSYEDFYDRDDDDDDKTSPAKGRRLQKLEYYHNLPVLFYLNREVLDLSNVQMIKEPSSVPVNSKNLYVWRVEEKGDFIGYAVRSILHNMMGDQAGVAMYEGAKAFGNIDVPYYDDELIHAKEEMVFHPNYWYECVYSPCSCRTIRDARLYRRYKK